MAYKDKGQRLKYNRQWRKDNPAKVKQYYRNSKEYRAKYAEKNKERIAQYGKAYRQKNADKLKQKAKEYRLNNREKLFRQYRERYKKNPKKYCRQSMEWQRLHPEIKTSKYRLDHSISESIRQSLNNNKAGRKWETLVGYTLEDLIKHLENLFDDKMNWDNYGSYWWIDHIKPKSLFKYETPEDPEFKECWALENLQPLEKIANIRKGNRFIGSNTIDKSIFVCYT